MDALFEKRLKESQKAYADSKAQQDQLFGGAKVPAGVYEATMTSATMGLSKKGKLQIKRSFVISTAGDYEGSGIVDYMQLETEFGYAFARRFIELCTGDAAPAELTGLPEVLKSISEASISMRVEVRHDGDFQNISVIEKLGGKEAPATEETAPAEETTPEADGTDENLVALKAFAASQEVTFEEDDSLETLKERISAFEYDSEKLIEDEITLLETNGLGELIKRPAPKAPAKVARPAPKPAPKPTPKPAPKPLPKKRK